MNNIRVCIDATPLLLRSAGVKTYVYYWIQHLARQRGDGELRLFPFLNQIGNCEHERPVTSRPSAYARLAVVHLANTLGSAVLDWLGRRVDVFHASHQLRSPPRTSRLTATIYDLTCWLLPEMHPASNTRGARQFADQVMRRAHGLIAISEHTRSDAIRILGLPEKKISVICPGVAPPYFTVRGDSFEILRRYGLNKPFVLFVGTIEPRKNLQVLLEAFRQLAVSVRDEFELVVVGSQGWGDTSVFDRLRSGEPGVRYLGYVPETDLPCITAAATVFAYPSLYEGFGLPVAQALAAGVPVVTSNVSSLPEIAGDAALLIDPRSPSEIASALDRLLTSPSLRKTLSARGRERAERYRWEVAARQSWEFFEAVVT